MSYREMRWPCEFPATLVKGTDRIAGTIVNVSAGGARLRIADPFEAGSVVTLDLGGRQHAATVRWCREGRCGLRLLSPLSKQELALIRRGRAYVEAPVAGRWNTHLRELR